jgi:tetratricopeptide (TPR) repeat protein
MPTARREPEDLTMEQRMSAFERYERGLLLKEVKIFDSALEEFQHAATDPQHAGKAHTQMALCLKSTGRHEEAVAAFCEALKSGTFSPGERLHILYLLGKTLEPLGRYEEALEIYRWIIREDPDFQDVGPRIKHLSSAGRGSLPPRQSDYQAWVGNLLKVWEQLKPHLMSLLAQAWDSLARYAEVLETYRGLKRKAGSRGMPGRLRAEPRSVPASTSRSVPVQKGQIDKRRHARIAVQLRSQFSSKNRIVSGEGELRDLSPWGCRITSPAGVPIGAELECCIFQQDELNPFTVDEATVRWIRHREFGLAFTKVRPDVQRQIAQLCRNVARSDIKHTASDDRMSGSCI